MDHFPDKNQYLVLTQNEEKEGDNEVINYWSEDDGDWFFDKVRRDFPNKGKDLNDITKAMHVWKPLKGEDWSIEVKKSEEKSDKP